MTVKPNSRIGSAFDEFVKDEGIFEEVQAGAIRKVVAHRLARQPSAATPVTTEVEEQTIYKDRP